VQTILSRRLNFLNLRLLPASFSFPIRKLAFAGLALAGLVGLSLPASARSTRMHMHSRVLAFRPVALLSPGTLPEDGENLPTAGHKYELKLYHLHTGESIDVVYRIGNVYIPAAMEKLNHFLRDHRTEDESHYDPHEFDLLHNLLARLGRPQGMIDVVCGYRTPESNEYLRTLSADTGVAKHSQHMEAKAIDIRVPGVRTRRLRDAALSLQAGGVGYYPISQFVHVDVGPVRHWTFSGHGDS
jgi:uncharacterized protein YcbK (DUF882 family)